MKNVTKFMIAAIFAVSGSVLVGCAQPGKKTAIGGAVGAGVGAVAGAIIGHQSGRRDKGALLGGAIGGLLGGGVGNYLDKQAAELAQIAETKRTEHGIVTKLKGDITFASGASNVKSNAQTNIQKISQIISKYPEDIVKVVGHTDSTGSDSKNQSLSQQRAQSVKSIMLANGVPEGSITVVGMGENQPISSNETVDGRAQNRRVEILISVDESKLKKN